MKRLSLTLIILISVLSVDICRAQRITFTDDYALTTHSAIFTPLGCLDMDRGDGDLQLEMSLTPQTLLSALENSDLYADSKIDEGESVYGNKTYIVSTSTPMSLNGLYPLDDTRLYTVIKYNPQRKKDNYQICETGLTFICASAKDAKTQMRRIIDDIKKYTNKDVTKSYKYLGGKTYMINDWLLTNVQADENCVRINVYYNGVNY